MSEIHYINGYSNNNKFIYKKKYSQASDIEYKELLDDLNCGYSDR
jgi:hypothetical protein